MGARNDDDDAGVISFASRCGTDDIDEDDDDLQDLDNDNVNGGGGVKYEVQLIVVRRSSSEPLLIATTVSVAPTKDQ